MPDDLSGKILFFTFIAVVILGFLYLFAIEYGWILG